MKLPESRVMFLGEDGETVLSGLNKSFTIESGGEVLTDRLQPNIENLHFELVLPVNPGKIYIVSKKVYTNGYYSLFMLPVSNTQKTKQGQTDGR